MPGELGLGTCSRVVAWKGHSRRVLPTLKLGTYNGSTCLKTFLAKYENCSDYYDWNDLERLKEPFRQPERREEVSMKLKARRRCRR